MASMRNNVFISSTSKDLEQHRGQLRDACLQAGMFPIMMENLPASGDDAIDVSLRMVDDADIYVGIFAYRYGYVPKSSKKNRRKISVTQMEYERAVERGIPRLIFVMHPDHPIKAENVETGDEATTKMKALKERIQTENIVNFFRTPEDLRAHVINSLAQYR